MESVFISKFISKISLICNALSGWLSLILVLLTAQQVLARYFFSESSIAMQELQWHLFAAIFLLASAHAINTNSHVRVDIFYSRLSKKAQCYIDSFGFLFFLTPSMVFLIYFGIDFVIQSRSYIQNGTEMQSAYGWIFGGEGSANPGGLPARWILKALIPLFALLNILQGFFVTLENWRSLKND